MNNQAARATLKLLLLLHKLGIKSAQQQSDCQLVNGYAFRTYLKMGPKWQWDPNIGRTVPKYGS
jgi:hypothetical protein